MKKILIVTSSYFFIKAFLIPHIKSLAECGWLVDVASGSDGGDDLPHINRKIDIPIKRTPLNVGNIKAIELLKKEIEQEHYDIVHCHTPIGALVGRLAAAKARKMWGTKVIYTAHGFHFYKGAPLRNWILYFGVEKALSHLTDAITTMNEEDNRAALRYFPHIKHHFTTSGIGFRPERMMPQKGEAECRALRDKLGLNDGDFVCLYIARLEPIKNHRFLLAAIKGIVAQVPNLKLILLGSGELLQHCRDYVNAHGLERNVILAGFHNEVSDFISLAHVCLSTSIQEGLPIGIVEEMYCEKSILASNIRGHKDLIEHGHNGLLYRHNDINDFMHNLLRLYNDPGLRKKLGENASKNLSDYRVENVIVQMKHIYEAVLDKSLNC